MHSLPSLGFGLVLEVCASFHYNSSILKREESKKLFPFCTSTHSVRRYKI
jgi:hypothetical protein